MPHDFLYALKTKKNDEEGKGITLEIVGKQCGGARSNRGCEKDTKGIEEGIRENAL